MNVELNEDKNKAKQKELDKKILVEEQKIKLLDQLESEFDDIRKSVSRCLDLMSNAVQGDNVKILYDNLYHQNNKLYKDSKKLFENDVAEIDLEIVKYLNEKNKLKEEKKEEKQ